MPEISAILKKAFFFLESEAQNISCEKKPFTKKLTESTELMGMNRTKEHQTKTSNTNQPIVSLSNATKKD